VFKTMGSRSKGQGCVRKDGSHSKGWGCVSKGRAPIRNDGVTFRKDRLVFETTQLCLRRARVRNDVVVFERTGSCLKRWGSVHKDGLALEMLLLCSKRQAYIQRRAHQLM